MEQSFRVKIRHEPITDIRCYALLLDHFRNIIRNKSEEHWEEQNNWKMAVLNKTSHWLLVLTALPDHQTCFQHQPPPGSVLLASSCCQHLEKSQGKKTIAKRLQSVRYHHKGFFMTHCWDWKNYTHDPLALQHRAEMTQHDPHSCWKFSRSSQSFQKHVAKPVRLTKTLHVLQACSESQQTKQSMQKSSHQCISPTHTRNCCSGCCQPSPACPQLQHAHSPSVPTAPACATRAPGVT